MGFTSATIHLDDKYCFPHHRDQYGNIDRAVLAALIKALEAAGWTDVALADDSETITLTLITPIEKSVEDAEEWLEESILGAVGEYADVVEMVTLNSSWRYRPPLVVSE